MNIRYITLQIGLSAWLATLTGCYQEPVVPTSIIPQVCLIAAVETVNEQAVTSDLYQYDSFGQLIRTTYKTTRSGLPTYEESSTYTYSPDHYLLTKEVAIAGGGTVKSTYIYEGEPKRIKQIREVSGGTTTYDYEYNGAYVVAYTIRNEAGTVVSRYTFNGAGKLTEAQLTSQTAVIADGKITRLVYSSGNTYEYQYDTKGQLSRSESWYPTTKERIVYTYTYDNSHYFYDAQLHFRGIPTLDLGNNRRSTNLLAQSYRWTTNGQPTDQYDWTYRHQFNQAGYSLGYARSDGYRLKATYLNCP